MFGGSYFGACPFGGAVVLVEVAPDPEPEPEPVVELPRYGISGGFADMETMFERGQRERDEPARQRALRRRRQQQQVVAAVTDFITTLS
jgi:hypothetical protein